MHSVSSSLQISTTENPSPVSDERLEEILENPGFGMHFSDHMLTIEWTPAKGWHAARIEPYGPLTLDPAVIDANREQWIDRWTEIVS